MDYVENWLSRLAPVSADVNGRRFRIFEKWLKANGEPSVDELVISQRASTEDDRFRVLDLVQRYVVGLHGRAGSKRHVYSLIRSFFLHNRADLPSDRSFRIHGDLPRARGTLTVEELRKIVLSCNCLHRAIYLTLFQSGMGLEEFCYWNIHGWPDYKKQYENGAQIIRIDLPGRKRARFERPYYTFHTGDALQAVKEWLPQRPKECKTIFIGQHCNNADNGISKSGLKSYWYRHLIELGLMERVTGDNGHRPGKGLHEFRDLYRTQWSKSPAKPMVAEYSMGHPIDVNDYDKSWRDEKVYRTEYLKALPYLQIMTGSKPYHLVDEDEVEHLRLELTKRDTMFHDMQEDIFELQQALARSLAAKEKP